MKITITSDEPVLPTDSTEYELLISAATEAARIYGAGAEIGVRRGGGSRMIMDAFIAAGVYKDHLMIDPWGDINYLTTEAGPGYRQFYTDYTNDMRMQFFEELGAYYRGKQVNPVVVNMEDTEFFRMFAGNRAHGDAADLGYWPVYRDKHKVAVTRFCIVHLDGPHSSGPVIEEVDFFAPRMLAGAMLVCDDVNLYDHAKAEERILRDFEVAARGQRKCVYRRLG